MPKQRPVTAFRPARRSPSRRISFLLAAISLFAVFTLIFTLPNSIPTGPSLSKFTDHKFSIPKFRGPTSWTKAFNPWRHPTHKPQRQKNDTYDESSWYSNWKWLALPFSSTITLDENRSLLPPLKERTPIYCFYDRTIAKEESAKDAESALLLTWRKAWWAQGFKPIILDPSVAMANPLYEEMQRLEMDAALKTDMMRWLAWEEMGGGLLSHNFLFPMGAHEDPLLIFLRRGEFPSLTRWRDLEDGLFAGPKAEIAELIKLAMRSTEAKKARDVLSALPARLEKDPFKLDAAPKALAFYNAKNIDANFEIVAEAIKAKRAPGLRSLNKLINAHLHLTWQNSFSDGVAVLKPYPQHTSHMIQAAFELGDRLGQCSESPMPSSCPPNVVACKPCDPKELMKLTTPAWYRNTSSLYTIGVIPHPYTMQTLVHTQENVDIPWIRRKTDRDIWLSEITKEILGTNKPSGQRLLFYKEAVAGEFAAAHSLWIAAERQLDDDIDWHFGFTIPKFGRAKGSEDDSDAGLKQRPQPALQNPADGEPNEGDLKREARLIEKSKQVGRSNEKTEHAIHSAMEAWNLADTEAWKFARAFLARAHVERTNWEKEESKATGGAGSEKGLKGHNHWSRWLESEKQE